MFRRTINKFTFPLFIFFVLGTFSGQAQQPDSSFLTLDQCITYAFKHQPALSQAYLYITIARTNNKINLAGWLPQVSVAGNLTHYNQLPTSFINDSLNPGVPRKQRTGIINSATPTLTATQALFSPSLLYSAKAAKLYVEGAELVKDSAQIEVVSSVSKAFYSLLLTLEQITVLKEDTARLTKNLNDAYQQYVGGIVDMTDYQEAAITLNTTKAQLKQAVENVAPQYATLKQLMGFPPLQQFNVSFDTARMKEDIYFDTTQVLNTESRIEFKILQTDKQLQHQLTNYYKLTFLPALSAFYNYNFEFQSNTASDLYANYYPYSYLGLSLSLPIFTGFSRVNNIRKAKLQERVLDWSEVSLRSQIYTEYSTALANYKSNLYNLRELQENVGLARNVYDIVTLQYQQGVVAYLNVITAESNLISSEIGYINALFQLLSSKVDLQKSMGYITYKP